TGYEVYDFVGAAELLTANAETAGLPAKREVTVRATCEDGTTVEFRAPVRVDTPKEGSYYRHGGILQYVLRGLLDK
ncbi:MAG: hypothetical protein H7123_00720, partial [Thermoleophilia bacterium]|nr:hypothetical protein [Thermoleophilia bacterium]